ncbi:hypothetical protein Tco_0666606 [Tanacetum coccineum]
MANTQTPLHPDHSSLITYIQHPQPHNNFVLQPSFNTNYLQHLMQNPKDISNPTTALDMALELMAKAFQLNNTPPTNNNQISSSNPCYSQVAQSGMNIDQERQMLIVDDNGIQNVRNQNGLSVILGIANQHGNINVVAARAEDGLAIEVEKVNTVNRKSRETNADLITKLARYKNQEKCFEISQEKYDKLQRCYQKSIYQEQCLTKNINALHLSSGKQITTLNEEISNLNNQLSKEKSTVSSLQEEKKKLKSDFKIREDELLDKQIQLENKIKELDNILVKTGQSIQTMHMLSPKPDSFYHTEQKMALGYQNPFYLKQAQQKQQSLYNGKVLLEKHDPPAVYDSEETLELAQESCLKLKQMNKKIKPANYTKINHLSGVFVSQTAKSREELYFLNTPKTANVSKSISIPNEEFLDDTTPSVARKFLNKVKRTIVTLQRVVKQKMTLDIHNWSSNAHQEIHKSIKDEILPIVNQVDARVQNFEIQVLKEAAKFVRDFKPLTKEADESLTKHKALELEIERLLRAVVSQDIMFIVQKCKYDKISYDKAYNGMQQKIERLQAQLGDQKGKSKETPCVSNTLDPLSLKLDNENIELEFQVSEQKDTTKGTSVNTQFCKQSILGKPPFSSGSKLYAVTPFPKSKGLPKIDETHALSKLVTSNLVPTPQDSKVVKNDNVIAP